MKIIIYYENQIQSWSRFPDKLNLSREGYHTMFLYTVPFKGAVVEGFNYVCSSLEEQDIKKILSNYSDITVILFSSRLIDILVHKKLSTLVKIDRSCVIQHGIYVEKLSRTNLVSSIFTLRIRLFFYLKELLRSDLPKHRLLKVLYDVYFKENKFLCDQNIWNYLETPKDVFCFSENGEHHFKKFFGDNLTVHKGYNLDLDLLLGDTVECEDKEVVYIAQTLVEDGRYSKRGFEKMMADIADIVHHSGFNLSIKLHPRSNIELYKNVSFKNLYHTWPICRRYIGHYSAINELIDSSGGKLFIYELKEHVIPKDFYVYGDVAGGAERLSRWLISSVDSNILNAKNQISVRDKFIEKLKIFVEDI